MKKLFIYYSLSGNGDVIADYLKNKNIEIRKVVTNKPLPNNMALRILTGGFLAGINHKDKLIDFDNNIDKYNEIIIGSPIWNGRLSCPINTVLDSINLSNKKITFILYSGNGKAPKTDIKISKMFPNAKIIHLVEPSKHMEEIKNKLKHF